MNEEQVKSNVRSFIQLAAGAILGWFASKGWHLSPEDTKTIMSLVQSPEAIGIVMSIGAGAWGYFTHTQKNAVAVVATIAADPASPVKGVITTDNKAGRDLADSIPGVTVVPSGTPAATKIATTGATL